MNPSTADVRNLVKEDLKFLAYDKEYARAADGVVAVSYTHLDVYKRQPLPIAYLQIIVRRPFFEVQGQM